jgi:hypothetical protein
MVMLLLVTCTANIEIKSPLAASLVLIEKARGEACTMSDSLMLLTETPAAKRTLREPDQGSHRGPETEQDRCFLSASAHFPDQPPCQ